MNPNDRAVFTPTVEGLIRGVGPRLSAAARAELKALGIDLDRPLKPGYPAVLWHRALELIARDVFPEVALPEAHFRMGARTVYGLDDTLVGKAMLGMIRLIGPRRALMRLPTSAKIGTNFMGLTLVEEAPNQLLLVGEPFMGFAEVMQGSVHALIEIAGAPNPRVEIVEYDRTAERMTLRAAWS